MKKVEKGMVKLSLCGLAIFIIGIIAGQQISYGKISSIQGYLFYGAGYASDNNASNSNATEANASSSNASSSNASSSNASDANASSSNVSLTDYIIYLDSFSFNNTSLKVKDKLYINIATSGADLSAATIVFNNKSTGISFSTSIENLGNNPYIIVPYYASAGEYVVSDLLLVGLNANGTTFSKKYSSDPVVSDTYYNFSNVLTIVASDKKTTLNSLTLKSSEASIGERVYVDFKTSDKLENLKLSFFSANNRTMVVYVKDLYGNPYFEIPSDVEEGYYEISSAILSTSFGTFTYTNSGYDKNSSYFGFTSLLKVNNNNNNSYIYNNEDITEEVLSKLYKTPTGSQIIINADSNSIISAELFKTIKGKNKKLIISYNDNQIIFNGEDINNSKDIDANIVLSSIESTTDIGSLVSYGIVVSFANNGILPGKATVKIKATDTTNILNDNVYVYYYDESNKKFIEIANDVKKSSDGYYEFTITHNSDYVIVNNQIDKSLLIEEDNIVSFQKSSKVNLLLILVGIIVVVGVGIALYFIRKNKKEEMKKINDINEINNDTNVDDENVNNNIYFNNETSAEENKNNDFNDIN